MGDFFNGWRRKIGVVALLMACVFLGGWFRNMTTYDAVSVPLGKQTKAVFLSVDHALVWVKIQSPDSAPAFPEWESRPAITAQFKPLTDYRDYCSQWCGLAIGDVPPTMAGGDHISFWVAPYWVVILSLTVFSVDLLLIKPKKSMPKSISDPTPAVGT